MLPITLVRAGFYNSKPVDIEVLPGAQTPIPSPTITPLPAQIEAIQQELPKVEDVKKARVTAYSCGGLKTEAEIRMNCPSLFSGSPKTATGTEPIAYQTVACDKANLGRTFYIDGIGEVKCTDTGGAIKGAGRFDLYVATVQEAREFGVQHLAYSVKE